MASMKRWLRQSGALFISIAIMSPVMPAPTASNSYSTSPASSPSTPPSVTQPPLPQSCLNIIDPSTDEISAALSDAAEKTLNDIRDKNPNIRIDDCVALWIDENNSFDEQVWFNENSFTALLFFDKGINPKQLETDGTCLKGRAEDKKVNRNNTTNFMAAANTTTEPPLLKRQYFRTKKTVKLESGIRIIGVPLKENNTLAEGHFVGIDHYFEDDSWSGLLAYRQPTFKIAEHNVLISGVTFWPVANLDKGYNLGNKGWHGEYVNVEIDEENPSKVPSLTLYRNQFVAMAVTPRAKT